jgi:uncharacterized membrane protein
MDIAVTVLREGGSHHSRIEQSIDVNVPVETAYNQWTQFEEFPRFRDGVKRVEELDDRRLRWHATVGGVDKSWEAEITEQIPDERVAWRSVEGAGIAGVVTFHGLSDTTARVMLQLSLKGSPGAARRSPHGRRRPGRHPRSHLHGDPESPAEA